MIESFINFTRLKKIVYLFLLELLIMSLIALMANSNDTFGKSLVQLIYDPIYKFFPEKFSIFLKPCLGLGCIFPSMTAWGIVYLIIIGIIFPILLAYLLSLIIDFLAKRRGIN